MLQQQQFTPSQMSKYNDVMIKQLDNRLIPGELDLYRVSSRF